MENRLIKECLLAMKAKGVLDEKHKERFKFELKEISAQNMAEYFMTAFDNKQKWSKNENNLLVVYLLGLADKFDIDEPPVYEHGEFPDIDIDYLPMVRDYLKKEWAPKEFGKNNICSIGNYTTFGLKSALIDMARVHSESRDEILALTTQMGLKDDEGKALTWDKALEINEGLAQYCKDHPDVAKAAHTLVNRRRGMGMHAGGLIVSSSPINNLVPLCLGKNGEHVSAWTEGLHDQDLMPVGLIKFDLLVITDILRIATIVNMVKKRHGIESIFALPGQSDWTDISYLNDPKALALANMGDTKGIFQFDSDGIRRLLRTGGVTNFNDLVAYSALYRPGPLGMGMDRKFCSRKKGLQEYFLHPLMKPILAPTHGVMVYQEQVMKILNVVGDIPLKDCEVCRKAISKKKLKVIIPYKEKFLERGQINLGVTLESVEDIWNQIEAFAEYGFNKSVDTRTPVLYPGGEKPIYEFKPGETVYCVDENGDTIETEVITIHDHGMLSAYEVTFDDGYSVICSIDHKYLTKKGQISLREICRTRSPICVDKHIGDNYVKCKEEWLENQMREGRENQEVDDSTSQRMSKVSEDGLEIQERWDSSYSQGTLREGISNLERSGETFERMFRLRSNKEREYPEADGEIKQRQRTSRQKKDNVRDSQENFGSSRNSSSTSSTIKEMENRESREIYKVYRSGLEESKTISDGSMASSRVGLGNEANSLWGREKTSRFCERQDLDRSRWILSLFQSNLQKQTRKITHCSTAGRDVAERSNTPQRCNVNSNRHELFQKQFGRDAGRLVQVNAGHASISNTGGLVSREILRVRYVGKRRMCDLEVANPTHNFLLPNGIVTSNSHSCAYTYISSRLLTLKAHYPIEFYCVTLSLESNVDKVKSYMNDAKEHDIIIQPIDINRSGVDFEIHDDEIYYGLSKVKGIGVEVSKKIVEHAPYSGFVDFMNRFGTEARVVQPLLALGAFKDASKSELHKFYEVYKDTARKRRDRTKRYMASLERHEQAICDLTDGYLGPVIFKPWVVGETVAPFRRKDLNEISDFSDITMTEIERIWKKWKRSVEGFYRKERESDEDASLDLEIFNADQYYLGTEFEEIYAHSEKGEELYYGFKWTHPLEKSDDYSGLTFEAFTQEQQEGVPLSKGAVQVLVLHYEAKVSKNDKTYHQLEVEDANSLFVRINIWKDDHTMYGDQEFMAGNMLQLAVEPPSGNFRTYTMQRSGKKNKYNKYVPIPKDQDFRVIIMHKPEEEEVLAPVEKTFADVGLIEID